MKKIIYITYILLAISFTGYAQDDNQNYVKTHVYLTANPEYPDNVRDTAYTQINVTYLDGLGRPKQQIAVRAGGDKKNIVTHIEYDEFGRQVKQYLPYSTGSYDMGYDANGLSNTNSFYNTTKYENTTNPYSESFFEDSPLARIKKTAAPGLPWKGNVDIDNNPDNDGDHTVKMKYNLNVSSDNVRYYYVAFLTNNTMVPSLLVDGYYLPGELYKTITKDENWVSADGVNKTTEEYTDKLGRVILKRNYNGGSKHDTYYVYDVYNNLTYVIPPLASDQIVELQEVNNFLGLAYPWVDLSYVDWTLADAYNRELINYDNSEILNVDLLDKYGGQGGFSLVPSETGDLVLNLNVITDEPMPLRTGTIADLKKYGNFPDKELGRISGTGFQYNFLIQNNTLIIDGKGKVPSQYLNTTLTGDTPLDYSKNYPWTAFCKGDTKVMDQYVKDIASLDNSEILTTYTPNAYNALGGVAISLDNKDDFTISFNMNTDIPMELVTGTAFPLEFSRTLPDVTLGTIQGEGYLYEFSVRNNNLYISGSGLVSHVNFWNTRRFTLQETIKTQVRDGLCYMYKYDNRNRQIQKKIPGKGWEYIVYDRLDRVVATQDQNLKLEYKWLFTKYDPFGRVAYTGIFGNSSSLTNIRSLFNVPTLNGEPGHFEKRVKISEGFSNSGATVQYSNDNYPTNADILELHTVSYYDNLDQTEMDGLTLPSSGITTNTKGLVVGTKVAVLGTNRWIYGLNGYDEKGREIWSHSKNAYLESEDVTENTLDFTGRVLSTKNTHKKVGLPDFDVYNAYSYDNQGRVLLHRQSQTPITGWNIGPYEHVIAENIYDELGMLEAKGVGGKTTMEERLQLIGYKYNVRGWLTDINNVDANLNLGRSLFAFRINYNTPDLTESTALYNGNISETFWKTKNDNKVRSYSYDYDALNRLTDANYHNYGYTINGYTENYTEGTITYDKNGNIKSLKRYGLKNNGFTNIIDVIDNLSYSYSSYSNKLSRVSDLAGDEGFKNGTNSGSDYAYDANGNMIYDLNKGIGQLSTQRISYNHLNLPTKIYFGTASDKYIEFTYDATGSKVVKNVSDSGTGTVTEYDNGYIYERNATGARELKFFNHPEGYVKVPLPVSGAYNTNNFKYIYQYKDHLGNVRLSYSDTNNDGTVTTSEIIEENNYYAFGLRHTGYNSNYTSNGDARADKYKYNGKELQDELGLNMYDYGARNYDPALGRWMNIDPLAEKYYQFSPYTYVGNMPTIAIDPDGNEIIFVVRGDKSKGTKDQIFTYRKGNFYHSNGKRYNPGKESISKTMYKTLSAYRKIEASDNKELKEILKTLETSKQKHYIEAGPQSMVKPDPLSMSVSETEQKIEDGIPVDTHTTYSFSERSKENYEKKNGIPSSEFGTIVHEMQHQYDFDQGNMADSIDIDSSAKDPAEIRAVNTENKARKMVGLPKRTKYDSKDIDPKKLN